MRRREFIGLLVAQWLLAAGGAGAADESNEAHRVAGTRTQVRTVALC